MAERAGLPIWVYGVAAVVGSFVGALMDMVLYADGGSTFLKVGFVVGPLLVWIIWGRSRAPVSEDDE